MTQDHGDSFVSDRFDEWLTSFPESDPPVGLRERCRATIAQSGTGARRQRTNPRINLLKGVFTMRNLKNSAVFAAIVAALVISSTWLPFSRTVLAQSVQTMTDSLRAMEQAPAAHVMSKTTESRSPDMLTVSEVWAIRGVATAQTVKVNDIVTWRVLDDRKTYTDWSAKTNEVRTQPSLLAHEVKRPSGPPSGLWMWLPDVILQRHDEWAKQSGIPAKIEQINEGDKKLRRVSIGPGARVLAGPMTSSLTMDIDDATNRPVRIVLTIDYSTYKQTSEFHIEYPEPATVDKSLFVFQTPKDAKPVRIDQPPVVRHPAEIETILRQLKQIGLAMHTSLDNQKDRRLPTDWVRDLLPYLGDNHAAFVTEDDKSEDREKPTYTSFRFFHAGEKYSDLKVPAKTVIAERRHTSGVIIRLFANGGTDVSRP